MFLPCQVPLSFKINVSCIFILSKEAPFIVKKIQALQVHKVILWALAAAQGLRASVSLTYFSLNMEFSESVRPQRLAWVKRKSLVKTGAFMLGTKPGTKPMLCKKKNNQKNPKNTTKWTTPSQTHTHRTPNMRSHKPAMCPASDNDMATTGLPHAHPQGITTAHFVHENNPPVLLFTLINIKSANPGYLFNNSQSEK